MKKSKKAKEAIQAVIIDQLKKPLNIQDVKQHVYLTERKEKNEKV